MLEPKPCAICGKEFVPKSVSQIACSPECAEIRKKARQNERVRELLRVQKCPICGKEMNHTERKRKYCSDACRAVAIREQKRQSKIRLAGIGSPCDRCAQATRCRANCPRWDDWFLSKWESIRETITERLEDQKSTVSPHVGGGLEKNVRSARAEGLSYGRYMAERYMEKEGAAK